MTRREDGRPINEDARDAANAMGCERAAEGAMSASHAESGNDAPPHAVPALAPGWAFFLDIDGTLLDIAHRPDAVAVDAELLALLTRLHSASGGALALISGRSIADIDRLFAPLRFASAGQHGAERRDARGRIHRRAVSSARLGAAREHLAALAAEHAGLVLEDKGASLALHYRMAPQLAERVRLAARDAVAALGTEFDLQEGKMVVEIKPSGRDKGSAIAEFMHEAPFAGKCPLFLGDDLGDEFGFALVNRAGGHAVKIGTGASCARWRLADAAAVRAWLRSYGERFAPD